MGSYHSLTPCASSDGTMIDMKQMNQVVAIDAANLTFTAQGGMQIIEASKALSRPEPACSCSTSRSAT